MAIKTQLPYILSDLDGTLSSSGFSIHQQTVKDILDYQKASDYKFSFVTGRLASATKVLADQLKVQLPIVSCNGAMVSDWKTNQIFYVKYLDSDLAIELLQAADIPGIDIVVYTETQLVGLIDNRRMKKWKQYFSQLPKALQCEVLAFNQMHDLINALASKTIRPIQLVFYADQKPNQILAKKIINHFATKVEATPSLSHVFNITAKGTNKLTGLKEFAKFLKINYHDIVVFGDNYNDISMVQGVKRGFVVANGVQELKKIAYQTVPAITENGVGNTLKQLMKDNSYD